MTLNADQRTRLEEALNRTFFATHAPEFKSSPAFRQTLDDHTFNRQSHFADCVVPWLRRHVDIGDHHVVEIGAGTGSSTAAIAPHVGHVTTFEIDQRAIVAAKARAEICRYSNVTYRTTLFGNEQADELGFYDGVFLAAVLEHCSFQECHDLLKASWSRLKPGGWLCVIDTPNRFCPIDHHTSYLPFFSSLPIDVRIAYSAKSPRAEFGQSFANPGKDDVNRMIRWGCGISYHEFEIAIDEDIHENIIADGWEPEINAALGILPEDTFIENQMTSFAPHVNRAFARRALYFVLRKPS